MKLRRRRDRRTRPYMCQRGCGTELHITGRWGTLPGILKCEDCGHMDRRLPGDRRATPPEPGPLLVFTTEEPSGRSRSVLYLELVVLAAIAAAVLVALL